MKRLLFLFVFAAVALGVPAAITVQPGGAPISGSLDATDQAVIPDTDRGGPLYYREEFTLPVGQAGMIDINLTASYDCYLILYGPSGQEVARNDDYQGTSTSRIQQSLQQTGAHRIIVTSFSQQATGTYTLTVGAIQEPAPSTRDENIGMGQSVEGMLEIGDGAQLSAPERSTPDYWRDGYAFRGRAGMAVTVDLACQFDGYLYLVDPNGTVLTSNDDFGSVNASRIMATLGTGGQHRIVVTSFSSGTGGSYTVSLRESEEVDPNAMTPEQQAAAGMTGQPVITEGGWMPQPSTYEPPPGTVPENAGGMQPLRGSTQIVSNPLNATVNEGDTFLTTFKVHNTANAEFDALSLIIRYDPENLRPLRVSDHALRRLLAAAPVMTSDRHEGIIRYAGEFAESRKGNGLELITIEWRALRRAERTRIHLRAGEEETELLMGDRQVLGTPEDRERGAVGCDVMIRATGANHLITDNTMESSIGAGEMALLLMPEQPRVHLGETFNVDLILLNPKQVSLDDLRVVLRFDAHHVEAVDAAPGGYPPQSDNWITQGINLLDSPFHEVFPFDQHLRNEVHNDQGLAIYRMGLSRVRPLPGGIFARLQLRAIAPGPCAIRFVTEGSDAVTAVTFQGQDVLGEANDWTDGVQGLTVEVIPN